MSEPKRSSSKRPTSSSSSSRSRSDELLLDDDENVNGQEPLQKKRPGTSSKRPSNTTTDYKSILTWLNTGGLVLLAVVFIIYVFTRPVMVSDNSMRAADIAQPASSSITSSRESYTVKEIPFTIVLDEGSLSMNLSLKLIQVDFVNLMFFDICCIVHKQGYFICKTSSKSLGIDAYITNKESVVVQISNQDLVGSACRLTWAERKK